MQGRLKAPALDAALTSRIWTDRKLAATEQVEYPNNAIWVATGNNIQVGGDLPRRCVWIRMDAMVARAFTRTGFKHDLGEYVPANHGSLLVYTR